MEKGKLIIFSAPSGSGKTTIVSEMMKRDLNLKFSVSATNREMRKGELDGKNYYFISTESFLTRINNDEFLEFEEVYAGTFYGTLKSEVERKRRQGFNVVFDVDVIGGLNIKDIFGDDALSIFIKVHSVDELRRRLENRNTDTAEVIDERVEKAKDELKYETEFDVVIENDDLNIAIDKCYNTINNFINE